MFKPFTPFINNYLQKKTAVFFEKMAMFFKKTAVFQAKHLGVWFKTSQRLSFPDLSRHRINEGEGVKG